MQEEIQALLRSARLDGRGGLVPDSIVSHLFALDEAWRSRYPKWVHHLQVISVFYDIAGPFISAVNNVEVGSSLVDAIGDPGVSALEANLLEFLESVPRQYQVYFPIRTGGTTVPMNLALSRQLTLVTRAATMPPREEGAKIFGVVPVASLLDLVGSTASLQVVTSGMVRVFSDDAGSALAFAVLRRFVGLAISVGVIVRDFSNEVVEPSYQVLDVLAQSSERINTPAQVLDLLRNLRFAEGVFNASAGLHPPQVSAAFTDRVNFVSYGMDADQGDGRHIRTAAEWLFDSEAESNQTTALLFAAIGLEAVLDSPGKETTERLADRLAWSLGGSLSERKRMADEYKRFYRVRCDLAHGRERELDVEGQQQLAWGRDMLKRCIAKELERGWVTRAPA